MVRLEKVSISIGVFKADFKPTLEERDAAWRMMVDLGTSIATQPFTIETGHLRDALDSLHRIFNAIKDELKAIRPSTFDGDMNFASVCMALLTQHLGPFLVKWHEPLADFEIARSPNVGELEHEKNWSKRSDCAAELEKLQTVMFSFTQLLSELAGVSLTAVSYASKDGQNG